MQELNGTLRRIGLDFLFHNVLNARAFLFPPFSVFPALLADRLAEQFGLGFGKSFFLLAFIGCAFVRRQDVQHFFRWRKKRVTPLRVNLVIGRQQPVKHVTDFRRQFDVQLLNAAVQVRKP